MIQIARIYPAMEELFRKKIPNEEINSCAITDDTDNIIIYRNENLDTYTGTIYEIVQDSIGKKRVRVYVGIIGNIGGVYKVR